jgi:hypothetical protein
MSSSDKSTGMQFVRAAWSTLRADRSLLVLPLLGSLIQLVLAAIAVPVALFVPGVFLDVYGNTYGTSDAGLNQDPVLGPLGYVLGIIALFLMVFTTVFFTAALVVGAQERLSGGDPSVGSSLKAASAKLGPLAGWAAIETVVSAVLRWISDNMRLAGAILASILGTGWSAYTYFTLPVIMFESDNPVASVQRSGHLFISKWGKVVRARIATGVIFLLVQLILFAALFGGAVMAYVSFDSSRTEGIGFALGIAASALAFIGLVVSIFLQSALRTYIRVMLYRHATGQSVPGVEPSALDAAFVSKK